MNAAQVGARIHANRERGAAKLAALISPVLSGMLTQAGLPADPAAMGAIVRTLPASARRDAEARAGMPRARSEATWELVAQAVEREAQRAVEVEALFAQIEAGVRVGQ